ncbi:uncharacterized protein UDID_03368 [Ustilago sp. UG-2017a]|nr:uncharacterized protein UDID_03368 [Ustilago sp. UG-2017a]
MTLILDASIDKSSSSVPRFASSHQDSDQLNVVQTLDCVRSSLPPSFLSLGPQLQPAQVDLLDMHSELVLVYQSPYLHCQSSHRFVPRKNIHVPQEVATTVVMSEIHLKIILPSMRMRMMICLGCRRSGV